MPCGDQMLSEEFCSRSYFATYAIFDVINCHGEIKLKVCADQHQIYLFLYIQYLYITHLSMVFKLDGKSKKGARVKQSRLFDLLKELE